VAFDPDKDPNGWLTACVHSEYIHMEENTVEYYRFTSEGATKISPATFRVGDIIEALLSLVISSISPKKFKILPILHSVSLIDSVQTDICIHTSNGVDLDVDLC
ncbi:hypothetical protein BV22DRAFT_1024782, partial [Leucogyrophana mollusca]